MSRKYIAVFIFLFSVTAATLMYQSFLAKEVRTSLKEGMQSDMNRAVTDLFIMKGEVYPSINMFYRFAGKSALFLNYNYAKNQGKYQEAGDFLSLLADKDDASDETLKQAYITLALAGRVDEAVKYAEKMRKTAGSDIVTDIIITAATAKRGDFQAVRKLLDESQQVRYNKALANLLRAWSFVGEKNYDEALKVLDRIKNEKAFAGPYAFHKALISDLAGKPEAATSYSAVLGKNGETASIRSLQAAISFFRRNGQEEKAKDLLKLYQKNPSLFANIGEDFFWPKKDDSPVGGATAGMAEAILGIATNYTNGPDMSAGVLFLRIALYLDDNLVPAKLLLAELLGKMKMYNEAVALYESLPPGNNLYKSSQVQMVKLLVEQKKFDRARNVLADLIKTNKDDVSLLIMLGDIDKAQDNYKAAAESYSAAILKIGNEKNVPSSLYAARGMMLAEDDRWEEAEPDLLKALAKNPSDPYVLNYLGYTWLEEGKNVEQAKTMIKMAAKQVSDDGYIKDSLGWMYYMDGNIAKAIQVLEDALQMMPANSMINNHLGDAYWKAGRKREAVFQWERAVKLNYEIKKSEIEKIKFKIEHGLDAFLQQQQKGVEK